MRKTALVGFIATLSVGVSYAAIGVWGRYHWPCTDGIAGLECFFARDSYLQEHIMGATVIVVCGRFWSFLARHCGASHE